MIVTPTYTREMGEGGRLVGAPRVPPLGLPDHTSVTPTYKSDVGVFKGPGVGVGVGGAYDHNKNSVSDKDGGSGGSLGPPTLAPHLQPFTAPWLAEVAHITPARPSDPHLQYPQHPSQSLPDYYPHYPSLPHRPTGYYPHHFLPPGPSAAAHFMRDYPRHAPRPYPPLDPRPPLERPTPVSGAPPLIRPLGPPPLRGLHPDTHRDPRDLRDLTPNKLRPRPPDLTLPTSPGITPGEPSPRGPHGEPSPKRRAGSSAFPMPAPRSPRAAQVRVPLGVSIPNNPGGSPSTVPPLSRPSTSAPPPTIPTSAPASSPTSSSTPTMSTTSSSTSSRKEESRPASPYHAHFARGALVTVGTQVRRVEDLETKDFLEAAKAADDLKLDPSTVAAITTTPTKPGNSTITFTFPSRNTQVSVEASQDHPFFVFHCGWSSCSPERTLKKYELKVRQLKVGDVCVSLTKKTPVVTAPSIIEASPMPPPTTTSSTSSSNVSSSTASSTSTAPSTNTNSNVPSSTTAVEPVSQAPPPPPPVPAPAVTTSSPSPSTSSTSSPPCVKRESTSLPFLGGSPGSSVWTKPLASRTTERQHSSDEGGKDEKDSVRKRRWSDPGQAT